MSDFSVALQGWYLQRLSSSVNGFHTSYHQGTFYSSSLLLWKLETWQRIMEACVRNGWMLNSHGAMALPPWLWPYSCPIWSRTCWLLPAVIRCGKKPVMVVYKKASAHLTPGRHFHKCGSVSASGLRNFFGIFTLWPFHTSKDLVFGNFLYSTQLEHQLIMLKLAKHCWLTTWCGRMVHEANLGKHH